MSVALCSVCGAAAHYRDPKDHSVSLCPNCASDGLLASAIHGEESPPSLEVIPEDEDEHAGRPPGSAPAPYPPTLSDAQVEERRNVTAAETRVAAENLERKLRGGSR